MLVYSLSFLRSVLFYDKSIKHVYKTAYIFLIGIFIVIRLQYLDFFESCSICFIAILGSFSLLIIWWLQKQLNRLEEVKWRQSIRSFLLISLVFILRAAHYDLGPRVFLLWEVLLACLLSASALFVVTLGKVCLHYLYCFVVWAYLKRLLLRLMELLQEWVFASRSSYSKRWTGGIGLVRGP